MDREIDFAQRISVLEHKVEALQQEFLTIDAKLDQILDLKAKGQGAFWVASAIFGIGLTAIAMPILQWLQERLFG
jgi:hypothetical protein